MEVIRRFQNTKLERSNYYLQGNNTNLCVSDRNTGFLLENGSKDIHSHLPASFRLKKVDLGKCSQDFGNSIIVAKKFMFDSALRFDDPKHFIFIHQT